MRNWMMLIGITMLVVILFGVFFFRSASAIATYSIGNTQVELVEATSMAQKIQGLSGTTVETFPADGMIFLYRDGDVRHFWMKGMLYDLDILWVANGEVVKIDTGIPAPQDGEDPARMSSDPYSADAVIELPAGFVQEYGIEVGDSVVR